MNYLDIFKKKYRTALKIKKEKGWSGVKRQIKRIRFKFREGRNYQKWIKLNRIDDKKCAEIYSEIENFRIEPLISVLMPVYNVDEKWLRICIESVVNQLYKNWEFCIADDHSPRPHVKKILDEYSKKDERVKVFFRAENGHISAASNSALEIATGEFCVLLDHDDELTRDALFYVAKEINNFPATEMIYSDEDMIDENGKRYNSKFKPDFSLDLMYSLNLVTHLSAYRTEILRKIGGFRVGAEGSQDYDLALRVVEQISEKQIRHIPRILYHWRAITGSVALSADEKPYAHERAREAIRAHLERTGKRAKVVKSIWNFHRVRYDLPENPLKISLIVYGGERKKSETNYKNLEVITTENAAADGLNAAAKRATGKILIFVDANLECLSEDWLEELTSFAIQKEIGAVGAKILSRDETVLHGGLVIGTNETISAAHRDFFRDEAGNIVRNQLTGNFSAVSIACFAVRRELFEEIGGFDSENLPNRFFDADFCLKLREKKYRVVFTPYAELRKIDDKKTLNCEGKPSAEEAKYFNERWREIAERDPFYNPNLSKKDASFSIEI